jgi:integrase
MKRRGGGSIYKRGDIYWIKYYKAGRPIRESSESNLERDAKTLLNRRMGAIAAGQPIAPRAERVRVDELLDDLITEYKVNGRRSLRRAEQSVAHVRDYFGGYRAQSLDTAHVRDYIAKRQTEQVSNATINRELAALKRAYTLGCQARKILTRPHIPSLLEDNARQGFFERDQFEAVCKNLPEPIQPLARFAYVTGWRVPSEVLTLTWAQVDFGARTVRLEPGKTKNRMGRMFPFTAELEALLAAQRAHTDDVSKKTGRIIAHVFHRDGKRIRDFRRAWRNACQAAGLAMTVEQPDKTTIVKPLRIPHDLRRTAVRNLERAGVPRSVAMQMVGHKTEAIYRRYAIVSESDLRAAAEKLHEATMNEPKPRMGTIAGTIGPAGRDRASGDAR